MNPYVRFVPVFAFLTGLGIHSALAQTPLLPPAGPSNPEAAATQPPPPAMVPAPPIQAPTPVPSSVPQDPIGSLPVLPQTADDTTASALGMQVNPAKTSMGPAPLSIFFTPSQIRMVEDALFDYESNIGKARPVDEKTSELADSVAPEIVEPETYPVFYLSSIVYRAADDWSVWVSGYKITSKKNTTSLKVLSVSPNQAMFLWAPEYAEALAERKTRNLFAPLGRAGNKVTRPSAFMYNDTNGSVTFTLRPNQSFVPAYMNTFEGFLPSPQLPPLNAEAAATGKAEASATSTTNAATSPDDILLHRQPILSDTLFEENSRESIDAQLKREKELKTR